MHLFRNTYPAFAFWRKPKIQAVWHPATKYPIPTYTGPKNLGKLLLSVNFTLDLREF